VAGSHLDTVPSGGRFDGTLGVFAAVRAVELLRQRGLQPSRPVWIVAFMDEEGSRFGASMFGSRAFAGEDVSDLLDRADADGVTVAAAMRALGHDPGATAGARAIDDVAAYLELHIEQGPVLERSGDDVGAVTAIAGLVRLEARFTGQANHAGTTPMDMRSDALVAAARAVTAIRDAANAVGEGAVATVGSIGAAPGAYNVVPGEARISVDLRCPEAPALARLEGEVRSRVDQIASEERIALDIAEVHRLDPTPLDLRLVEAVESSARDEQASVRRMASGAGHDAMVLARHVPAGMLFVPSRGGISHNPDEHTPDEACELGARVLAGAIAAAVEVDWESR
jgi:hydantoinase/carbamoylase family amidase